MNLSQKIKKIQEKLETQNIDGWLFYDFRRSNPLACAFLEIPKTTMLTRRFFYWIPKKGTPVKIVSSIEMKTLATLPGNPKPYKTWKELETILEQILKGCQNVAMEYSPRNAVPYISKVDAGTVEVVRDFGVHVVSSADLLQEFTSVWDEEKLALHLSAEKAILQTIEEAWNFISINLKKGKEVTEYEVQQLIVNAFHEHHCVYEGDPICAVNAHASDPHYAPSEKQPTVIVPGDFILIDLWCKKDLPRATYVDITQVAVAAEKPTPRQSHIFDVVKQARDEATNLVRERMRTSHPLMGWEIDQCCRDVIEKAGYGEYFIHRTGHNIDESDHGDGANIDNYETQEKRQILRGTCFSIEPGIYLPGEFGVRLEYDLYIHLNGQVQVTGGIQESIRCLL